MPGKREYEYCLTDTSLVGKLKLGAECDQGVDISDTKGGGLAEDVQNGEMSEQETTEDEHEAEVEQPTGQSQRPVRIRKPPNRYGELILNYLQQMLEDKEQGAKKIIFTACHSGKLKLAFTSPDVISTSPQNFLYFCYSNSS